MYLMYLQYLEGANIKMQCKMDTDGTRIIVEAGHPRGKRGGGGEKRKSHRRQY